MNASGEGDQIGEISKEDESEISSTTPDNGGIKPSESEPFKTASESISSDADSTAESSVPQCEDGVPECINRGTSDDIRKIDVASTTAKLDDKDNKSEVMEVESGSGDQITPTIPEDDANNEVLLSQDIDHVREMVLDEEDKQSFSKEIFEKFLSVDKDSDSLDEDIKLRWEDDEEDVETTQTADVLKLLDRELGIDSSDKPQEVNDEAGKSIKPVAEENELKNVDKNKVDSSIILQSIEDNKSSDSKCKTANVKQDVEIPSDNNRNSDLMSSHSNDGQSNIVNIETHDSEDVEMAVTTSIEESENIIQKIDNLIQNTDKDIDMENPKNVFADTPQITDQVASLINENKDEDIDMDKDIISEPENPAEKISIEVTETTSESSPKEGTEMDVDTIPEIRNYPSISKENIVVAIETYAKKNDETVLSKALINNMVLENKDAVEKPIEIATTDVSKSRFEIDNSSIKEQVSKIIHTVTAQSTQPDILCSPVKVSTINDKVKLENKDGQTSQDNLEAISNEQLVKDKQITDDIINFDVQKTNESHNIIKDVDENTSNLEDSEVNKLKTDKTDGSPNIQDVDESHSQDEDSILDTSITPNVHHRINKPNVMLDIPTQEFSDIEAELDDDDYDYNEEKISITKIDDSLVVSTEICTKGSTIDVNFKESEDLNIKELKDVKIVTEIQDTVTTSVAKVTNSTIEIDATSSKLNLSTVSPTKPELVLSKPTQGLSVSKSLQFDETSTSTTVKSVVNTSLEHVDDKLITSNLDQDIGNQKQSTSKLEQIIDKPVTLQQTDDKEEASTSKPGDIPNDQSSTSKDDENQSSPKEMQIDDVKASTSKVNQGADDEKPCTSKDASVFDTLMSDNTETQEVTDSLGLLAESSRVMDDENDDDDDDDDAEDPEAEDNDDDEDFDPYDETNSEIADDMDDSNTPPPELDPKDLEKPGPSSQLHEERESDECTMDIVEGAIDIADGAIDIADGAIDITDGAIDIADVPMDIVDDIECVENELQNMQLPDDAVSETPSTEENTTKNDPEIIDADTHKETSKSTCQPNRIINILEKVLGRKTLTAPTKTLIKADVRNYVEVEGSSDSDDVSEVPKDSENSDVISVNIPKGVEVMSTSGPRCTSEIVSKEGEVTISGVPKPPPQKMSKINTSEVSIKTTGSSSPAIHIPEMIVNKKDEIFNLDSDEEDGKKETSAKRKPKGAKPDSLKLSDRKCINPECTSESQTYYQADRTTAAYYSLTRRSAAVCEECRERASERTEALIDGIKELRPLLELDMSAPSQQLVEISDSDSDEEGGDDTDCVGERGAQFLEEHLADMINDTWIKYKMESRFKDTQDYMMEELGKIEADTKELDMMLDECQRKTDAIRLDFYKDYELRRKSVGAIIIHDTPFSSYSHTEKDIEEAVPAASISRYPKRRGASVASDSPAKRAAIPLGYSPLQGSTKDASADQIKADDDKEDISVVKLSAEAAPADLPPCGEIVRPPLKTGMILYAMRNAFGTWLKGRIVEVQPKQAGQQFTQCRVKFEHKVKNPCKVLAARCLAYPEPSEVRMTIGTRVVALFKDPQNSTRRESFYSGVIAEIPNPVNSYRYLVFFDDGYAQYVRHQDTRIVCESSNLVWEEVHPFIRDFICNYLLSYPERPMVRLHAGEKLKTEWNGKWWDSKVLKVDASIALINFDEDNRTEWIYRGSTRLAPLYLELKAAEKAGEGRVRTRLPRSKAQTRSNMPCVEYTRSDEQAKTTAETQAQQQHNEELRRQRAVAKKSTTAAAQAPAVVQNTPFEGVISRVVYYTPKNAVKPYKMTAHSCTINCRRSDLLSLKDLRTYNPLAKPLLSGWERQTVRYKGQRAVAYRAPCGRRVRSMRELHRYLRVLHSDLAVDLFDFTPGTHCLAEFVLHKCIVSKKDLSHGKENVPVPCVNYYDDSLPEFCSYNTERTPTAGVPLNLDPEFLCGCDCIDDCMDKTKCACWKMTLEGARTIGLDGPNVGYVYRRLPEPLPSGIYECNSRCKCKKTCLNRVAQHPLQLKLQVFKTINRGWGIRALNDVPKGSFLCIYAGNLLTDATANLDGLNEGDEYLAELDYIEVVEGMKEGYEEDIPNADKKLDKKNSSSASESDPTSESDDDRVDDPSNKDDDFQPGYIPQPHGNIQFKKSLRKREKAKKKEEQQKQDQVKKRDDCITISDDEEVREPSRFTAQAGMVDKDLISKHSSRVSVRTLFGKDEACYIMDAKVQGNIGRYLNHSCHPNVFVQNVFVDTHDPRFPWVAFFALSHVRAGAELTWNYNYDIGSVPEKVLYCYCGAPNCRGRLL